MSAINPNSLSKFVGQLYIREIGDTGPKNRLASIRGLVANIDTTDLVEVIADDTGTVFKATKQKATIEAELLENASRDTLALLFPGSSSNVAGTPVTGATKEFSNVNENQINLLTTNLNGITSIVGSVDGAITGDYETVEDGSISYIIFRTGPNITTLNQIFTVTYDYTPNISEDFIFDINNKEVKSFEVTIEAYDDTGKKREIVLSSAGFTSTYNMSFLDVVEAGDITGSTLTFEGNKGSTLTVKNEII